MTVQISLADDVCRLAAEQAKANGYASAGDYLADLIRGEARREQDLRNLLEQGEASGPSRLSVDAIISSEFAADEANREWLRAEIQQGLDSGLSTLSVDEIFDQALAKASRRCA